MFGGQVEGVKQIQTHVFIFTCNRSYFKDKGGGAVKKGKILRTSFMDGPLLVLDEVSSIIPKACTEELPMFRQHFRPLKYIVFLS